MRFNAKKFSLGASLVAFVFTMVFGAAIFAPKPARAQLGPTTLASDPTLNFTSWVATQKVAEVKDGLKEKAQFMFMSSLMNGLNYFANKIAYDMGVWMASGNWGQGPFTSGKAFGSYMAQVAGDSLGEMLGSLSQDLGLNLCDLPDLRLDLAMQLGFHFNYNEPKPTCTWQRLRAAYNPENVYSKYASREGLADRIGMGVQVKDTDFGIWLASKERIDAYATEQSTGKQLDRQEGEGVSAMTDIISGKQVTPAAAMKQEMLSQTPSEQKKERADDTRSMTNAALQKGATTVALNAVSTFVNTLLGTVVKNFITKGMLPGGAKVCNPGLSISGVGWDQCAGSDDSETLATNYYSSGSDTSNRRAAQELFADLLAPKITTLENYDLITNMAECSEDNNSPDACVIDQSFMQLLQQADLGDAFTIKQAVEKGLLHGDWKLVSPGNAAETDKWTCAQEAYCYRNLKFLRQARILPVGFEIAAYISDATLPPSLSDVVDKFYDSSSPYFHLINPQWVVKMPKLRCASYAYGAVAQSGVRVQECVDLQHCVAFNKDGSCQSWGYCMKEKPIWKFDAEYCDATYNTCRAFTGDDGDFAYLTRTLDTTECNADNAGCTRYARDKYYVSATNTDWYSQAFAYDSTYGVFSNTGIHFNKSVPTCDAANDGCSAYKLANNESTSLYLKKAPDYLGCYDADSSTAATKLALVNKKVANGIQWPQTPSDLNLIQPQDKNACADYAQVCLPEEENCNYYTASYTGEKVPAKFTPAAVSEGVVTWNDQCDSSCDGYASYEEMPSSYSSGQNLSYIIPKSGSACAASEAGCTSFTNLNATSGGMEQNEYFSYLRLCALPDQNKQLNYTVYESSESGGYTIKTYTLVKNNGDNAPKQVFRDADEYADLVPLCSKLTYENGTADPDCHQFITQSGEKYYALLSKTILATDQCTAYRLNNVELFPLTLSGTTTLRCPYDYDPAATTTNYRTGSTTVEFKNNVCYYMGTVASTNGAGDSRTCSGAVDSCRAYKGNAGNNVRLTEYLDFEDGLLTNWKTSGSAVAIATSTESTQIGGHSLRVAAAPTNSSGFYAYLANVPVTPGKSYTLTFWAKGNLPLAAILFSGAGHEIPFTSDAISASDVWKYYSFSLNYTGNVTTTALMYLLGDTSAANKQLFIDNIRLTEVTDFIYLVKNSLSVNSLCDGNLTDDLPGEALGCTAYSDPNKNIYYLTGFNYLCRDAAVGCTAVLDTYNTPDNPNASAYNVWMTGASGEMTSVTLGSDTYTCQVPSGGSGCYVNIAGHTVAEIHAQSKLSFTDSTVYIPPDTPSSTPIYLVANKDASCKAENMGCEVLGKASASASGKSYYVGSNLMVHYETFEDTAVLNNPALYSTILCKNEETGCRAWTSGDSSYYFKKPANTCDYHTDTFTAITPPNPLSTTGVAGDVLGKHENSTGWALKDAGYCLSGPYSGSYYYMGRLCKADSDCVIDGISATGTCQFINQIPCYPEYRKPTGEYDIWSFGNTAKYHDEVGNCPTEQSGCTEYVDHSSSGDNYKCAISGEKCASDSDCTADGDACVVNTDNAYYLLDNEKLQTQESLCNGQVSQAEGCILLDNTNNPNKFWATGLTYQNSTAANEAMISPASNDSLNDANIIMKVTHDRKCAEWAYCDFKNSYTDSETGETTSRCYHLGVCDKAGLSVGTTGGQCDEGAVKTADWVGKGRELTAEYYQSLYSSWDSIDLSGYSVPFTFQVPDLKVRNIEGTNRLVYVTTTPACTDATEAGTACSIGGTCYNGECLISYLGATDSGTSYYTATSSRRLSCRGYPEDTSPYSNSILSDATVWGDGGESGGHLKVAAYKENFDGVGLCYGKNGEIDTSCDCSYSKLGTMGGDIYTEAGRSTATGYICSGGEYNGMDCDDAEDDSCGADGICVKVKSVSMMNGWQGYCMEYDLRQNIDGTSNHRCLTWWPLELAPGTSDIWATDPTAGYEVGETDDRYMCLANAPKVGGYSSNEFSISRSQSEMTGSWEGDADGDGADGLTGPRGEALFCVQPTDLPFPQPPSTDPIDCFGLNLSPNSIISGCWNTDTDMYDTDWGLHISGSHGKYCPMNEDTLRNVSNTSQKMLAMPDGQTYLQQKDIERIDVYIDGGADIPCDGGYVSFYNNILNDEGEKCNSAFCIDPSVTNCSASSFKKVTFDGSPYGSLNGWSVWQWTGGSVTDENWYTGDKHYIINGLNTDIFTDKTAGGEANGIGIRIVFDSEDNFRGIWVDGEEHSGGTSSNGLIYVITLRDGRCAEQLQVSNEDNDQEYFGFKPFTGRLAMDALVFGEQHYLGNGAVSADRSKDLDNPNYGLNMDSAPDFWINPFVAVGSLPNPHTPLGNSDPLEAMKLQVDGYSAGIPLNVVRVKSTITSPSGDYKKYLVEQVTGDNACEDYASVSYSTDNYPAYCKMLTRMFAKVYSQKLLVYKSGSGDYAFRNTDDIGEDEVVLKNGSSNDYDSAADAANPSTAKILKLNIYPPRVAAPITTGIGYKMDAISVNDQTSGNVYLPDGATAVVRFYAWASPNQMPLRRVAVKKGDGTDPVSVESVSLSNKKPECTASKFCQCPPYDSDGSTTGCSSNENELMPCDNDSDCVGLSTNTECGDVASNDYLTFGSTSDTGCKAEPYEFIVDYSCPMFGENEGVKVYPSAAPTYGIDWDTDIKAVYGDSITYVCAFKPKVQALDNWGWCTSRAPGTNGGCDYSSNSYVKGYGCYSEYVTSLGAKVDHCALSKSQPWINYSGWVIVVPM